MAVKLPKMRNFGKSNQGHKVKSQRLNILHMVGLVIPFLGILTPTAYIVGERYYMGWLQGFGVESAAFPLNTLDVYVQGYYGVAVFLMQIFPFISLKFLVVSFLLAVFGAAVWYGWGRFESSLQNRKVDLPGWVYLFKHRYFDLLEVTLNVYFVFILTVGGLLLIILVMLLMPFHISNLGTEYALKSRDRLLEKGCIYNETTGFNECTDIVDKNGTMLHRGFVITASGNKVALLKEEGTHIIDLEKGWRLHRAFKQISPKESPPE